MKFTKILKKSLPPTLFSITALKNGAKK